MHKDRRKHKRYEAQEGIFAAFLIAEEPVVMGRILNMSGGGLGAQYLATRELKPGPITTKIIGRNSSYMEPIKSTLIYDSEISEASWGTLRVGRCGIKFERGGPGVQAKLKKVLKLHPP